MKRKMLSLLMAFCLMLSLAPAAFAVDATMDETTFRNAVAAGGEVVLTGNVTLTSKLTINKAVVIDGTSNQYAINYTGSQNVAIEINTNDQVDMYDLTINATAMNDRGIDLLSSSPHILLENVTMNVNARGISFKQDGDATDAVVELYESHILNSRVTGDYAENTAIGDLRGISLFDTKNCKITLESSSIKGFGYSINLTGTKDSTTNTVDFEKTNVNVVDSDIFGWTAFNVWSSNTIFNISGSHLRGINPSYGSWDSFATIVVNDDIYNQFDNSHADKCQFNISDTLIDNFIPAEKLETQIEAGAITVEFLFRIDSEGVTEADMTNVTFQDNTDVLGCAFIAGNGNYTQAFYDYIMGNENDARFVWHTPAVSTYSDGETELPLVVVLAS